MSKEVSKEWIKNQFNLTDEDLKDINVEEVSTALWWTQEEVLNEFGNDGDAKRLLAVLNSTQKQLNQPSNKKEGTYNSIFNVPSTDELPDLNTVKVIEFIGEISEDEYWNCVSGLLDINNNKIYYTVNNDIAILIGSDIEGVEDIIETYDISDDEINDIINSINKDYFIPRNSSNVWTVVLEFNDGSVYRYSMNLEDNKDNKLSLLEKFFSKMNDKTANGFLEPQQ